MKLYDAAKETAKVEKALAGAGRTNPFQDTAGQDEFDSLYGDENDSTVIDEAPLEQTSFYAGDSTTTGPCCGYCSMKSIGADEVLFGDGLVEVKNTAELRRLLYDLPPESKPRTGDFYRLSPDKRLVENAIAEARRKKGEWAKFQVLYDLHPIVRHWMNKLQAGIDRDAALVVKTDRLPKDRIFYLFHGQISNDLGQAVLSDFFLVGLDGRGDLLTQQYAISLREFVESFGIGQTLYNDDIPPQELDTLREHLDYAVTFAQLTYMLERRGYLFKEMRVKQEKF